jgi:hypothetical protein
LVQWLRQVIRPFCILIIAIALFSTAAANRILAQPNSMLTLLKPMAGEITEAQSEQRWTFEAAKDQRLSIRMQATSGNLNPHVELLDSSGKSLGVGRHGSFGNSTIDAFVAPAAGIYTLRATRDPSDKPTAGTYTISLLPGFSYLLVNDPADARSPMRTWKDAAGVAQISEGKLRLQLTADNRYTYTTAEKLGAFKNLYIQAEMRPEQSSGYWECGLLLRGVRRDSGLEFYVFFVNSEGKWKLAIGQPGGLKTLRDWTILPGTVQPDATLGMMIKDSQLTLFYNGRIIADLTDASLAGPGLFGVAIGTGKAPSNTTTILFDNIVVTLPADESANAPVTIPTKLVRWQQTAIPILEELLAARLIPNMGKPGLEEKDAFVSNNTKTIILQPMAKSVSFTDLVYSADIIWESNNENIACGLEFRASDDKNFTIVYIDRKGGYGILQRSEKEGDVASLYNLAAQITRDNRAVNRVTVIAIGNALIVYINGVYITHVNVKQASGITYIAAYNYEQASSLCQFKNVWLRAFDQ